MNTENSNTAVPKHVRPWLQTRAQSAVRWFFRIVLLLIYRVRVHGLNHYPLDGPVLICANHQSFLDPIIIGVVCPRPINYLARHSLFRFKPLGWFLRWNDAIPIDLESNGLAGMKETLRRLKRGETVMIFPEGTRTSDGQLQPIKLGFVPLARRSKATLLPLAIQGAFQAYPRHASAPGPGQLQAVFGRPILYQEYASLTEEQLSECLTTRLEACLDEANAHWERKQN